MSHYWNQMTSIRVHWTGMAKHELYWCYMTGQTLLTWSVHGFVFHSCQCTNCHEAHGNFDDESACLMTDNISNDMVTNQRSQVLKMSSSLHIDIFCNCFIKIQVQHSFLHLQHITHQLSLVGFSNCVAVLALDFDTICFSDFLDVCSSSLAPMSSNFSSVSTQCLCFCFLSIKSSIVRSLFTKLWIVCLLGTLSPRNLSRNFCWHFPGDLYFTQVSYKNTRCYKVLGTMTHHIAH
jgi:hypothetical protein